MNNSIGVTKYFATNNVVDFKCSINRHDDNWWMNNKTQFQTGVHLRV